MKIKVSIDKPIPSDGGNLTHTATSWQISRVPDFTITSQYIAESLNDTTNLLEYRPGIELADNVSVYARIKYHFSNGSSSNWSKIIPINTSQRGIKMSGTVIVTPRVSVEFKYNGINFSNLKISTSDYKLYSGAGDHVATDWILEDIDGKVLWSRLGDNRNLTEITIDSSFIVANGIYIIKAVHHSSVNTESLYGKAILNTNVSKNSSFNVELVGELVAGRDAYFKLWLYVRNQESTDIIIKDVNGVTVVNGLGLAGNTFNVDTSNLLPYNKYTILARIRLADNSYSSYIKVGDFIAKASEVLPLDQAKSYLNRFDFTQEIQTKGATIQSSIELFNNDILTVKHNDNSIYRQKLCNGKLQDLGPILTLDLFKSMMDKPYVNIKPLKNGKILIDYNAIRVVDYYSDYVSDQIRANMDANNLTTYDIDGITIVKDPNSDLNEQIIKHRPKFLLYEFNPIKHELTLVNELTRDNELYGTAPTNSLVEYDGDIYYIPTMATTGVDNEDLVTVKLKKLNLDTFTVTDVATLPNPIKGYATLFKLDNDIYLTGGGYEPIEVNYDRSWNRDNNNIYKFLTLNSTWANVSTLNSSIPVEMYALAAYTRVDGRVVLFNNVYNGASVGDQRSILIDYDLLSTIYNSDMVDNLIYRNAIQLRNGDILRISSRTDDPQLVYTYISDTKVLSDLTENDTIDIILDLVVPVGKEITVEDLYRYESITIEGDSDTNTGVLKWVDDDGKEYIFRWNDLIITRPTTIEQDLYLGNINEYNTITVLQDSYLDIYNVINVPAGEIFTIDGPITVKTITIGENGELIIV